MPATRTHVVRFAPRPSRPARPEVGELGVPNLLVLECRWSSAEDQLRREGCSSRRVVEADSASRVAVQDQNRTCRCLVLGLSRSLTRTQCATGAKRAMLLSLLYAGDKDFQHQKKSLLPRPRRNGWSLSLATITVVRNTGPTSAAGSAAMSHPWQCR